MSKSWHAWQNRVRIGETPVGRGVFALRAFQPGQVIGVIQGIVCRDPQYASPYCMDLGDGRALEPIPPFRFLNHCCEPRAQIVDLRYVQGRHDRAEQLLLETVQPITPGDEITIDYAWNADNAIPCLCGSRRCRGWVVDLRELGLLNQTYEEG
jgi:hypothetical protein